MRSNHLEISPLSAAVGAEIAGVDLAAALPDPTVHAIRAALAEHGVVVFRDQALTPAQHIAAARRFGAITVNRFFAKAEGFPEIALVTKEPDQKANIGGGWHTDHSYDATSRPRLDAVRAGGAGDRRRHAVRQHVRGVRRPVRGVAGRRWRGCARSIPAATSSASRPPAPQGPHRQPRAGDPGRRASRRHHPPRERAEAPSTSTPASPCASTAGPPRSHSRCCNTSTATPPAPSSPARLRVARPARWRSGTTARRGTTR